MIVKRLEVSNEQKLTKMLTNSLTTFFIKAIV